MRGKEDKHQIEELIREEGDDVTIRNYNEIEGDGSDRDEWGFIDTQNSGFDPEETKMLAGWSIGRSMRTEIEPEGRFDGSEKMFITFKDTNVNGGNSNKPSSRFRHRGREYIVMEEFNRFSVKILFCRVANRNSDI